MSGAGYGGVVAAKKRRFVRRTRNGTAGGPGIPVPNVTVAKTNHLRRMTLFLVLFVVMVAIRVMIHQGDPRQTWHTATEADLVTGPLGPFPAAFADEPPSAPAHVIDRLLNDGVSFQWDSALAHGLSIERMDAGDRTVAGARKDAGVKAVNLRTGKDYWRYARGNKDASMMELTVSERTVVIGYSDQELVGVDLRTGKPLWRAKVWHKEGSEIMNLTGGQVIARTSSGTLGAFDERDGRRLWTAKVAGSCPHPHVDTVYVLPDHLRAVHLSCDAGSGEKSGLLLGIDDRTGKVLWHQHTMGPESMVRGGEQTLIAPDPDHPSTVRLLDVDRRGIVPRATLPTDTWAPIASGSGIAVSAAAPRGRDQEYEQTALLRAYDTRDGHLVWHLSAPHGQVYGLPKITDGRVYVVRQPHSAHAQDRVQAHLLVLDAKTGHLLHTLTLRLSALTSLDGGDLMVNSVADGAVDISWRYRELLIATD